MLKIDKSVKKILQEVGVRQSDNMAPVLFLFLMSSFAETLAIVWKQNDIEVVTAQTASMEDFDNGLGAVKSHSPKQYQSRSLSAFEILQCLYVDDGASIFSLRQEMTKGLDLVYRHFARLGLDMYIGRE